MSQNNDFKDATFETEKVKSAKDKKPKPKTERNPLKTIGDKIGMALLRIIEVIIKFSQDPFLQKHKTLILVVLVLLAGVLVGVNFPRSSDENQSAGVLELVVTQPTTPIERVRYLTDAPDEEPFITTLQNSDILREHNFDFFEHTRDGDTVLIYPEAQWAIIYREAESLIVVEGPIDLNIQ